MSADASSIAAASAVGVTPISSVGGAPAVVTTASLNNLGTASQFLQMTPEMVASATPVDPALQALLHSANLCEQLIKALSGAICRT